MFFFRPGLSHPTLQILNTPSRQTAVFSSTPFSLRPRRLSRWSSGGQYNCKAKRNDARVKRPVRLARQQSELGPAHAKEISTTKSLLRIDRSDSRTTSYSENEHVDTGQHDCNEL